MKINSLFLASLLILASCNSLTRDSTTLKFIDPANIDTSVSPGDNFYEYANGAWFKSNEIPATESQWGSFNLLAENNYKQLHDLLDELSKATDKDGVREQLLGNFYLSGMDTAAIEKLGSKPLNSLYAEIDACSTAEDVLFKMAENQTKGMEGILSMYVGPDDKNVNKIMAQFSQSGLGMPDRDYYFSTDERSAKVREAYRLYIEKMLGFQGQSNAKAMAQKIFDFEKNLATASWTRVECRDPDKMYNKFAVSSLAKLAPQIEWLKYLSTLKINTDSVLVAQPSFIKNLGLTLVKQDITAWKTYAKFHILNGFAPYLNKVLSDASFDFYVKTIRGQKEQKPRWKRVLFQIDGSVGELLGQVYVDKHFKPEAKARMLELVKNLQETYSDRINRLDWMEPATKARALAKLNTFVNKIGYPDKWKSFTGLKLRKVIISIIS